MKISGHALGGRRGISFVELVLAMTILSIIGTAVVYILAAAGDVSVYSQTESTAIWEVDFAWHRISANALAAIPPASGGMTPSATTDANGQSRLTFIVPDQAGGTTRVVKYYCTGSTAPFTLVEDDARYNAGGNPSPIARNVSSFAAGIDASTTMKINCNLRVSPGGGVAVTRHFVVNCRDF